MVIFFIFGTFFGSFANVCIRRLPFGKSIIKPASHCPKCLIPIRWKDNLPVISFLLLKGKCRNCEQPISKEYPFVELLTGIYFLISYLYFGVSAVLFISLILGMYLIIISFIDFHLRIIPDILSISLLIIGFAVSPFNPVLTTSSDMLVAFLNSAAGALTGGAVLWLIALIGKKIYRKEVMGGGDIKLIAAGGSFLGVQNVFFALFVACLIGGLTGLFLILIKNKKISDFIPFGPYISLSILIVFFALGSKAHFNIFLF